MRRTAACALAIAIVVAPAGTSIGSSEETMTGEPLEEAKVETLVIALPDSVARAVVVDAFSMSCVMCHHGARPAKGLSLEPEGIEDALVGVASAEIDTLKLVDPEVPERSYLIMKLEGDERIKGRRMPVIGDPLSAEVMGALRSWIGALSPNREPEAAVPEE